MLHENVTLLNAYAHLLKINPKNKIAEDVVKKTHSYIKKYWYDDFNGGFYGNTDVHGEDQYYGEKNRSKNKPRIEKTKYSDWNSEAILTYLNLWKWMGDEQYKKMAEKSLDFFAKEMVTDNGVYHYFKENGVKSVRGNLSKPSEENSILSLSLLKLYRITGNRIYLNSAVKTMGIIASEVKGLDRGYYYIKSANYIIKRDLLTEFKKIKNDAEAVEVKMQKIFWLNSILEKLDKEGEMLSFSVNDNREILFNLSPIY